MIHQGFEAIFNSDPSTLNAADALCTCRHICRFIYWHINHCCIICIITYAQTKVKQTAAYIVTRIKSRPNPLAENEDQSSRGLISLGLFLVHL